MRSARNVFILTRSIWRLLFWESVVHFMEGFLHPIVVAFIGVSDYAGIYEFQEPN